MPPLRAQRVGQGGGFRRNPRVQGATLLGEPDEFGNKLRARSASGFQIRPGAKPGADRARAQPRFYP